jgi:phosphohistidine phosphatase
MKTLYLFRHAKSNWDDNNLTDIERPLNKRGFKDATNMGNLLAEKKLNPELIISSPAIRAFSTAEIISEAFNYPKNRIISDSRIYEATMKHLVEVIREIDDAIQKTVVFGHNPGFTNLANLLGDKFIDNMPTCSIAGFEMDILSWKEIDRYCGKLVMYEYPKKR